MKVLFDAHTIGQNKTGLERYAINIARSLQKAKKIELILYANSGRKKRLHNGLFRISLGFNKAIRESGPDILHTTYFAPVIKTIPVVITVHDLCFKTFPETFQRKILLAFELFFKKSLEKSDAIICVSETVRKDIINLYSINPRKIFTVYEAADDSFRPIANKQEIRRLLKDKFDLGQKYFLVVGNIEKRKNPIPVINSFLKLSKKHKNIELVFAGTNKMENLISQKYENLIKNNKLKFLGYISEEDLNVLYNGSLALIYNSLCEGFGLPILEAMATKTPVICNDLTVFKEITANCAIIYHDQDELSRMMGKILINKSFRRKFKELGYKRSKFFSWPKTAKQTINVYEWVLRN